MPSQSRPSFARQALLVAGKDLRIELRNREILYTMVFLAVVMVLVFSFAFVVGDNRPGPAVTAGILWVALVFSGVVALGRVFDRERDGDAVRPLLLAPVPRSAIYAGKVLATVAMMLLAEAVVAPLCAVLFSSALAAHAGRLAILLVLGTVGFAAVGSIFSAALLRSRSRDALLAALLYPLLVPVLIAGVEGTALLLDPEALDAEGVQFWMHFLIVADLVFLLVGLWSFEPVAAHD